MPSEQSSRGVPSTGPGGMLALIRNGEAVTRADLARRTGLARSTVGRRVDTLIAHRLVSETVDSGHGRGRPAARLSLNEGAGVVLVADVGATHARLALADMAGAPLRELALEGAVGDRPERILSRLDERFSELLAAAGRGARDVRGIGLGLSGSVQLAGGEPIMPGSTPSSISRWFQARYAGPVLLDDEVNLLALGEHRTWLRECRHLLFVNVGTTIGSGIVADWAVHRGADGGAGDIGHIAVAGHDDVICRCGNPGCLE